MNGDAPAGFKERLIVFTRYPEPGTTKTRLIPVLGSKGAADFQRKMTEWTLIRVKGFSTTRERVIEICYEGGNKSLMRNWLGPDFIYRPQGSGDIGIRMKQSFEDAFRAGADTAVIIGTDIPELSRAIIENAFNDLTQKEMVLGPAKDGGYYLIGLKRNSPAPAVRELFTAIQWKAGNVLEQTTRIAEHSGMRFSLLQVLEDVDRPEDLKIWKRLQTLNHKIFSPGDISIVIPALNEADCIEKTLACLAPANIREVIIADGGSADQTVSLAKSMGAKVVTSAPPKARQMNQGAALATGDVLLFLHADTRVPKHFDEQIIHALGRPGMVAGAFELRIDSPRPELRIVEHLANWRARRLKLPYGDQGLFISSRIFHQAKGFPDIPIMEDFELVRRLRKKGEIVTLSVPVLTSPRRWQNFGILKTTLINQMVIAAYLWGVSPDVIARWYRRRQGMSKITGRLPKQKSF